MAVKTFDVAGRCYEVLLENDRCTIREVWGREKLGMTLRRTSTTSPVAC